MVTYGSFVSMANLPDQRKLASVLRLMRAQNVSKLRCGDLEIELGPPPRPSAEAVPKPPTAEEIRARAPKDAKGVDDFIRSRWGSAPRARGGN
jgi:hypothetical protein